MGNLWGYKIAKKMLQSATEIRDGYAGRKRAWNGAKDAASLAGG